MAEPETESHLVDSAGCTSTLDEPAAGCTQATSDDGTAADMLQAGPDGAGCASAVPADTAPAGPEAPRTVREFERALQGLGFTRRQAASIARNGFKASAEAEAPIEPRGQPPESLRLALDRLARTLKD